MQQLPTSLLGAFARTLTVVLITLGSFSFAVSLAAFVFILGAPYSGIGNTAWMSVLPGQMGFALLLLMVVVAWGAAMALMLRLPEQLRQIRLARAITERDGTPAEFPPLTQPQTQLMQILAWTGLIVFGIGAFIAYLAYTDFPELTGARTVSICLAVACGVSVVAIVTVPRFAARWDEELLIIAKRYPELLISRKKPKPNTEQQSATKSGQRSKLRTYGSWALALSFLLWPLSGLIVAGFETGRREQFEGHEVALYNVVFFVLYLLACLSIALFGVWGDLSLARDRANASRAAAESMRSLSDTSVEVGKNVLKPHAAQSISTVLLFAATVLIGVGLGAQFVDPGELPVWSTELDAERLRPFAPLALIGASLIPIAWATSAIGEWRRWRLVSRWQDRTPGAFVPYSPIDFLGMKGYRTRQELERERKR